MTGWEFSVMNLRNSFIKDTPVCEIKNNQVRLQTIAEADLTLTLGTDICRSIEISQMQIQALNDPAKSASNTGYTISRRQSK